jgi:hypothetical protein
MEHLMDFKFWRHQARHICRNSPTQTITGRALHKAIVDQGCHGRKTVNGTEVLVSGETNAGQGRFQSALFSKVLRVTK